MSHFIKDLNEYESDMNVLPGYIELESIYISKMLDIPMADARERVKQALSHVGLVNPKVTFWHRDLETFDKAKDEMSLMDYINSVQSKSLTLAPSFTCYTKVDKDGNPFPSMHGEWCIENAQRRSVYKKKASECIANKDYLSAGINDAIQKTMKIKNNSLSGLYSLTVYPMSTHSSHYTLTSTTRIVASIGNIVSEKMIMGNRIYVNEDDPVTEFLAILSKMDKVLVEQVIARYGLSIPTVDDVMSMVEYNTFHYWRNDSTMFDIRAFVSKLDGIERTAVMYTMDLYHMDKLNTKVIGSMLTRLSMQMSGTSDDISILQNGDEALLNVLHHVCSDRIKGKKVEYTQFKGTPTADILVSTYINIKDTLDYYQDLIHAFFRVDVMPINVAKTKEMTRRAIVLSDTDSTCGSYYYWAEKYYGEGPIDTKRIGLSAAVMYFTTETMNHCLKLFTANTNTDKDRYKYISMKPEYFWSVFVPANVSKHYFNKALIKELMVLLKPDYGVSGVNLIATNIPKEYGAMQQKLIRDIIDTVEQGKKIDIEQVIEDLIATEQSIYQRSLQYDSGIYNFDKIRPEADYKGTWDKSNFFHYRFYQDIFAGKYMNSPEPPFVALKIPLTLQSKKDIDNWIASIEDKTIRDNAESFFKKVNKDGIGMVRLSKTTVDGQGIPDELKPIVDHKKIILNIMSPFYMVLETLNIFLPENTTLSELYNVSKLK